MNGLYTARITDRGVHEIFVEEDVLELEHINDLTCRNRQAREEAQIQANLTKALEAKAHWERNQRIVTTVVIAVTSAGVLLGLAHFGAIAGWVAHTGVVAGSVAAFYKIKEA